MTELKNIRRNWYDARAIMDEFHVSRSTAYRVLEAVPTKKVGSRKFASRMTLESHLLESGMLPTKRP